MAIKNKSVLKNYFLAGNRPTQQNFADLIDSLAHVSDAATGMLFTAADSITQDDIGKLVILKDGKAQLPEFVPAGTAAPQVIEYTYNWDSLHDFVPDTCVVTFTDNPSDGDTFYIVQAMVGSGVEVTFRTSPSATHDVIIGATVEDTIDNLISHWQAYLSPDTPISIVKESPTSIVATCQDAGRFGYFSFYGDSFAGVSVGSGTYAVAYKSYTSVANRIRQCLIPFFFLRGLGFLKTGNIYDEYYNFYQGTEEFTEEINQYPQIYHFPASLYELKAGIAAYLTQQEDIENAVWLDNRLRITSAVELPTTLNLDSGLDNFADFWQNAFSNGNIITPASHSTPSYCNYPLLGLVKSVQGSQIEIHTDPICTFRSSFDEEVSWTSLMDNSRVWALDSEHPGYLRPVFSHEFNTIEDLFNIAAPGYVFSLEHTVAANATFTGAFSTEMFALQVFYMIIQSSEEE